MNFSEALDKLVQNHGLSELRIREDRLKMYTDRFQEIMNIEPSELREASQDLILEYVQVLSRYLIHLSDLMSESQARIEYNEMQLNREIALNAPAFKGHSLDERRAKVLEKYSDLAQLQDEIALDKSVKARIYTLIYRIDDFKNVIMKYVRSEKG